MRKFWYALARDLIRLTSYTILSLGFPVFAADPARVESLILDNANIVDGNGKPRPNVHARGYSRREDRANRPCGYGPTSRRRHSDQRSRAISYPQSLGHAYPCDCKRIRLRVPCSQAHYFPADDCEWYNWNSGHGRRLGSPHSISGGDRQRETPWPTESSVPRSCWMVRAASFQAR